jgi:hypothetical protein
VRFINNQPQNKIAEVIEASTARFTAECYQLYGLPPLGSLVRTGDIYAVVAGARTASLEPGRRAIARGKDEPSEEAVYQASPQLARLLRSEFEAVVVGHKDGDKIKQYLPPQPARIHGFVYLCPPEEVKDFGKAFDFLSILLNENLPVPAEELIAACLRQLSQAHGDGRAFLVAAGKELAGLLSGDYIRLKNILGRLV